MSPASRLLPAVTAASGGAPPDAAALADALDAFLAGAGAWARVAAERDGLRERLGALRRERAASAGPLRILLVGGTGAGKSTLLNALAGAEIARASAARPTTLDVTCYHHRETSLDTLGDAVLAGARRAPHDHDALRDKILLDAPDFDSAVAENREVLLRALQVADFVITVATVEKYLTHELFRLLAEHRARFARASFVFVLNKADLGVPPEVVADFRSALASAGFPEARVLRLGARGALRNRLRTGRGAAEDEGEFPALVRLLEEELDRQRIRAIKEGNLAAALAALALRVGELLPDDPEAAITAFERECAAAQRDFSDDLAARLLAALEGDREARNLAALTIGSSFSWFYGATSGLAYAVRSALRPDFARLRGVGREAVRDLLRDKAPAGGAVAIEELDLLLRGQVHAARRQGLAGEAVEGASATARRPEALGGLVAGIEAWLADRLDEAFRAATTGRTQRIADLILNLPPAVFAAVAVGRLGWSYAHGAWMGLDFLGASAALLLAVLGVEFLVADRLYVARAADRCFAAVAGLLRRETEAGLGSRLLEGPRAVAQAARDEAAAVARLRRDAEAISRGA